MIDPASRNQRLKAYRNILGIEDSNKDVTAISDIMAYCKRALTKANEAKICLPLVNAFKAIGQDIYDMEGEDKASIIINSALSLIGKNRPKNDNNEDELCSLDIAILLESGRSVKEIAERVLTFIPDKHDEVSAYNIANILCSCYSKKPTVKADNDKIKKRA